MPTPECIFCGHVGLVHDCTGGAALRVDVCSKHDRGWGFFGHRGVLRLAPGGVDAEAYDAGCGCWAALPAEAVA